MKKAVLVITTLILCVVIFPAYSTASPIHSVDLQTYLKQNGRYLSWFVVQGINENNHKYQVAEFEKDGVHSMIFLKAENNVQLVRPIDKLILPPLGRGRLETMFCKYNSHFDPTVIAWYAHPNPNETTLTNPDKAWRANRKTEKFEMISKVKLVECDRSDES